MKYLITYTIQQLPERGQPMTFPETRTEIINEPVVNWLINRQNGARYGEKSQGVHILYVYRFTTEELEEERLYFEEINKRDIR